MRRLAWGIALWVSATAGVRGAGLRPETLAGFERYVKSAEDRIHARIRGEAPFLWTEEYAERAERLRRGEAAAEAVNSANGTAVPGGLIHDWIGAIFVRGVSVASAVGLAQDYNRHAEIYAPEVAASRVISNRGNYYRVYMRLFKKKVFTAVLDTEYEVEYFPLDDRRWHSRSYSVRVAEVENAGRRNERVLPEGRGKGFLWRVHSYWRFEERDGGVFIECQVISLARDVPTGLGWLIQPIVRDLPKESLLRTLEGTRRALSP